MTAPLPDRYAVIGHPVAHSQSPFIHHAFAQATGQALHYDRIECAPDQFQATVQAFQRSGLEPGSALGPARGCNITVPFKFEVLPLAMQVTPRAQLAQAANVLRFDTNGWLADNSDGVGLMRDLQHGAGRVLAGQQVLLIGAGGAAAGVLGPLIETRPARVVVANRSPDKSAALVLRHRALAEACGVALHSTGLADCGEGFDVVINSSASSLGGGAVPVSARVLAPGALAVDLMYGPAAQGFLDWATRHGAQGRDGLGMLVEQAAEAFALWRDVHPHTAPVLAALRAKLQG